jgi:type IV pilus assembly protein PilB
MSAVSFKKGAGCDKCNKSGYLSRTGINEIVVFNNTIANAIISKASSTQLYQLLRDLKVKSLRESALSKIIQGITTIEEVVRVIGVV